MFSKLLTTQASRTNTSAVKRALLGASWASPAQANLLFNAQAATFFTLSKTSQSNKNFNLSAHRFFSSAAQTDSDNDDAALTSADESDDGDSRAP